MEQIHTIEVQEQGFDEIYTVHAEQNGGRVDWVDTRTP